MSTKGMGPSSIVSGINDPNTANHLREGPKYDEELLSASELSYEVDISLAYSSEKLANLENLLLRVLSEESDIGLIDNANDDDISCEFLEKAFAVDLLFSILHLELREVDGSTNDLQDLISNAICTIYASDNSTFLHDGLLSKLHNSEKMLKNSQESVLEMKIQLAKLQMNSVLLRKDEWQQDMIMDLKEEFISRSKERPRIESVEHRHVLRMLEKSLERELDLEKKFLESKQNEEDLKSKNVLLEKFSVSMEEAAQDAWSRFLEADNASTVLMGISKELLEKFRLSPFHPSNSSAKEEELSVKLKDCLDQLNDKESLVQKLKSTISQLTMDNSEVTILREKVQMLEKNLETSESRLRESYSSNEKLVNEIKGFSSEIESLRESLQEAEIRAESAEEKVSHLTDSNMELMEEIDFLKDTNGKKASLLEEQLRELGVQFQQARASSEASLEQQNMLYSAIWDMETLIDELKQKVSNSESDKETVEERNVMLSEKNEELKTELGFLKARLGITEEAFNKFDLDRKASAKDICLKTGLIMDMVMQIGSEREHILKKVNSLMKENKSLRKKLHRSKKDSSEILEDDMIRDEEKLSPVSGPSEKPETKLIETLAEDLLQVETSSTTNTIPDDNRVEFSRSTDSIVITDKENALRAQNYHKAFILVAVVVALLLILACLKSNIPFIKSIKV